MSVRSRFVTYIYFDPKSGMPRYVGKGNAGRPANHLNKSSNPQLDNLIKKRIKEGYEVKPIILEAESNDDAVEMEELLIALIGREDLGLGPLFNHTDGGDGGTPGRVISPETCERISRSLKGKPSHSKGKTRISPTDETRLKLSLARKKRVTKDETRQKMSMVRGWPCTVDGITIYPSRRALQKSLGRGKRGLKSPNFRYVV